MIKHETFRIINTYRKNQYCIILIEKINTVLSVYAPKVRFKRIEIAQANYSKNILLIYGCFNIYQKRQTEDFILF